MAYKRYTWRTKDPITKSKMQNIEDGIYNVAEQADQNTTNITNLGTRLDAEDDALWEAFGYNKDSLKNKSVKKYIDELTIPDGLENEVATLHDQVFGAITQNNTTLQGTIDEIRQTAQTNSNNIGKGFNGDDNTIANAIKKINTALDNAKTSDFTTLAGRINSLAEDIGTNGRNITTINNWFDNPTGDNTYASLLLKEITGAHRTTTDTLDGRFDDIDDALSKITGSGDSTLKTQLTNIKTEIEAARESTIYKNSQNENTKYITLDARLEADEENIKGIQDEIADAHRPGVENDNLNTRFTSVESALSTAQTALDGRIDTVEATANAAAVASEVESALSGIDARLDALDGGSIADADDGGSLTGRVTELEVALDYTPTSDEDTTPAGLTQRISAAESDIDTLENSVGTINTALSGKANIEDVNTALASKASTEAMNTAITDAVEDISTTIIKNKNEVAYTDNVPSNTQTWTISDKDDYLLQAADDKYYYWKHINNAWHLMGGASNGEGGGTGNSNAEDYETYESFSRASREENKDYYVLQDDGVRHHYRYLRSLNGNEQEVWTLIEIGTTPDNIKKYNIFKYAVPETDGQSEKTYMHLCEYDYGYENIIDETFEQPFSAWISGTSYQLDDYVIYDNYIYKCINENTDTTWIEANWQNLHVKLINTIELPQGGGGITSMITISNVVRPTTISNGKDARFSFKAITNDESDITSIKWYVDGIEIQPSASNEMSPSEGYGSSGIIVTFNAKGLLKESGRSTVRVEMTSGNNARFSRSWTVQSNEFSISWNSSIQPIMLYTTNEEVNAIVNVVAAPTMTNIVEVMVNNDSEHVRSRSVTGTNNVSFALDPSWFNIGENLVTAIMKNSNNEDDNTGYIHYTALWAYGASTPLLAFADSEVETRQYEEAIIRYYAYNPNSEISEVSLKFGNEDPHISNVGREMQTYRYISNEVQTIPVVLSTTYKVEQEERTVSDSLTLDILESPYNLAAVSGDSLRYELDPNGHNNTDLNRDQFGNITFSNNFDWANGGFKQDAEGATALVVKKGSTITLPRTLFTESDSTGKTIDISFKITNSDIYEAEAFSDVDNSASPKGLKLKANSGELYLMNSNPQTFRYCEENRIDLSIHIEGPVDQRLITVWLDGIPSYVGDYSQDMLVQNNTTTKTVIGSPNCDIWIYSIRVYNQALSEKDMVQNYIANGPNSSEKIKRFIESDIYDGNIKTTEYYSHPIITPEKLHAAMPNLTIIEIEAPRMTRTKSDPVPAHVKITDQILVTENDSTFYRDRIIDLSAATGPETKDGCVFKVQGTSSVAYARSALNMDIDFKNCVDADGNKIKYAISENSIGVNYLNIKVNVASSENANNICAVDWYNEHQPFLIQARKDNASIRDTVEGKPCAVFFTNTSNNTIWVSSQRVAPGEQILYVMGDLCNSKKNTEVFGQTGEGIHYTKCCIEDSGNDTDEQRFLKAPVYNTDKDEWNTEDGVDENGKTKYKTHFEWRMEPNAADKEACIQAWTETTAWVVSVKDDPVKFKEEFNQYFIVEPMLYHFLMIEYFAAYDNVSKNTFYSWDWQEDADQSKWNGYRWSINKAYDWDTLLAYDNDGKPLGDYGIDYGEMENNKSFFNAIQNPIWLHIQSEYKTELNALYTRLRSLGTWNSNAIAKKWDDYQAIRPHAAMIRDAYVKYIYPYKTRDVYLDTTALGYDNNYLGRLAGSKIYQRHQFLTYQTSYMDGKYGYYDQNEALQFRTNGTAGTKDFSIKSYAKTYVTVIRDGQLVESRKVATGGVVEITNVGVGNNTTLYLSPDRLIQYIHPLNETQNSTFVASGAVKLTDVILGGEEVNRSWLNTSNITVPSPILKTLDIHNIETFVSALNLRGNTELTTLDTRNTGAGIITIAPYAPLTSLKLNACAGIVLNNINTITNSDNITIENTNNLQYITMENCNYIVMSKVMSWLAAALENKTDASDFNIRIIGLRGESEGTRFELSDATVLDKLLKASSIDAFGVSGSAPCVLTGLVYIPRVGSEQLKRFREAWGPNLDIDAGETYTQWTVKFVNYNGDPIKDLTGKVYEQIVDDNGQAYDPVTAGEVAIPTRPATAEYTYTYSGWDGLEGAVQNATKVVRATYTSVKNRYTITWYAGNQKIKERTEEYGEDISAYTQPEDDPNINFPFVRTDGGVYRVFKGWDRPVGKLTSNTNVYALWDTSTIGESTQDIDLTTVSAADLYAISQLTPETKTRLLSEKLFWDEPIPIKMGNDFYFTSDSNVNTIDLLEGAEELALSGSGADARVMRDVTPLISLDSDWTLALDYKFLMTANLKQQNRNEYVLLSCYQNANNSIQGFKISLMPSSNTSDSQMYINVTWGDKTTSTPIDILTLTDKINTKQYCQSYRNVIVLRHKGGEEQNKLYIYYTGFNGSNYNINAKNSNGDYITEALTTSLTMTQASAISTPVIIGGNYSGTTTTIETSNSRAPAKAIVYWGKYWNADLGSKYCRQLAAWPHETEYFVLSGYENDQTDITKQTNILDNTKLNLTCINGFGDRAIITPEINSNIYGWSASSLREFCNNRIRSSFPTAYRSIIKQTLITSNYQDFTSNNTAQVEGSTETQDYIYLPSYKEVNGTAPSSAMQNNEARRKWPWLTALNITALTPGTDGNNLVAAKLTSEALLRCRFFSKPLTTNTRIFYKTENPATTSYIYNDQRVTLQSGDVWYTEDQVVNSDFSGSPNTYIYYTDEEINKGVYVDIVTTNGGWKRAGMQELRTYNYLLDALNGSPVRFYKINTVGTIIPPSNNSAANGYTRIICPEFSL